MNVVINVVGGYSLMIVERNQGGIIDRQPSFAKISNHRLGICFLMGFADGYTKSLIDMFINVEAYIETLRFGIIKTSLLKSMTTLVRDLFRKSRI